MKKALTALLSLCMLLSLAACSMPSSSAPASTPGSTPNTGADPAASGAPYHIGYAAPGLNSEYNMMIYDGMTAACEARGVKLDVLSCEGDVSLQVEQIQNFITMGVDSIITYPVDAGAVTDILKDARAKGIRVVINDAADMDLDSYDACMSASGYEMGDVATQLAADWIDATFPDAEPGTVKVAVFGFWFTELTGIRCDVMCDIESYTDKAVLVETYNPGIDNFATVLPEYTSILLQQHPDIACILSFTDTFAIMIDEVLYQNTNLDFSKIGQFTVDRTEECFNRIQLSASDASTIRGTAVPGLNVVDDMLDAAMGLTDDMLDENKMFYIETLPVDGSNIANYL